MATPSQSSSPPLSNANGHISRKKTSSPTKSPLPPGWERVKSDQGAYYYWDKRTGKTSWKFPEEEGMCVCVSACACAWLLPDCVFMCNWIGTISTCTAVLTNDLHVQLVCAWARARAILRKRERGGVSYNLVVEAIFFWFLPLRWVRSSRSIVILQCDLHRHYI